MNDYDLNSKDLNDFFSLISKGKKEKKEQSKELLANSFEDYFWKKLKKEDKQKSIPKKSNNITESLTSSNKNDLSKIESIQSNETPNFLIEKSLGILSEPDNIKQKNDLLTPLNQKFATFEDLNKHYNLFLSRIQQQLSTLGGGGESNLTYMDVPITSVTSSSYTIKQQDYYIGVNYLGAVTITLPKVNRDGKIFIVKDELGEASKGTNRYITIIPTGQDLIDGRDKAILAYDYGSLTFIWKDNSWRVI